ncbi:MAG: ABC transporter permease [Chloroflexi bacterium]|nr:ABC transporter permease [Chloroflexota bacterium]
MSKRRFPIPTRKTVPRREIPPLVTRRKLRRNKGALLSSIFLAILATAAISAPILAPYHPLAVAVDAQLLPPSSEHWAGTDLFGRDIFSRLLFGARVSLLVGVVAVVIASVPGLVLGLIAGYNGRWIDGLIMRVMDMMLAFPGILLALSIVALLGPGLPNAMIAVGIAGIPNYTRLVRGSVLVTKRKSFVRAARAVGCPSWRIVLRHILPDIFAPVLVLATLDLAWAILSASSLSFLGLGAQPPAPEWGAMLSEGRGYLRQAPWITAAPGLAIMLTVLSVNLLGDGLRDALDPQLRTRA